MIRTCHTPQTYGHSESSSTSYSMEAHRSKGIHLWRHSKTSGSTQKLHTSNLTLIQLRKTWSGASWRRSQQSASERRTSKSWRAMPSFETSTGQHSEKPSRRTIHRRADSEGCSHLLSKLNVPRHQLASSKLTAPTPWTRAQAWVQTWVQTRVHKSKMRRQHSQVLAD